MNLIKIDCYISDGCASEDGLRKNITVAIGRESLEAEVAFHRINEIDAHELEIKGSPTVLINGIDILPGETPGIA